ncbi:MAG: helix-turn-helix domain-containing protein [Desulfovibrio sp.]|jgi:hypothetical protein|nr:helix-turn-helix domain-containing protein [Desulfovibrio sp.]
MSTDELSDRLRSLASTLQVDFQTLARAGRVSKSSFSSYVHGNKFPRMETIANWIEHYGVNANWLIVGRGPMFLNGSGSDRNHQDSGGNGKDPVIERMNAAVRCLQQAKASDEMIQKAITTILDSPAAAAMATPPTPATASPTLNAPANSMAQAVSQ